MTFSADYFSVSASLLEVSAVSLATGYLLFSSDCAVLLSGALGTLNFALSSSTSAHKLQHDIHFLSLVSASV